MISSQPEEIGRSSQPAGEADCAQVAADHVATLAAHLIDSPDVFLLQSGAHLPQLTLAYQTYGRLNERRDNAILVCHGFTGSAHAAGIDSNETPGEGWWNALIGSGKPFDTDRFFVISSNVLGGCRGSTGPSSIDPRTSKPYGSQFPEITIGDIVAAQRLLLRSLGIDHLLCVAGGSMGGMQAMEWGIRYPDMASSVIPIACAARFSAQALALSIAARRAIEADAQWHGGDYYGYGIPARGLAAARFLANITYLSPGYLEGRVLAAGADRTGFQEELDAETRLFVNRFDANSFIALSLAMESFDLTGLPDIALSSGSQGPCWRLISYTSDWLFPSAQLEGFLVDLHRAGAEASHVIIESSVGHDSFIVEPELIAPEIRSFLSEIASAP